MSSALIPPTLPLSEHRLDNGLRVLLAPDHDLPLVAVNLWYHVGSRHERPGRTGLAHLFEHMLFQGSANVGTNDHFAYVQQVGGVANGSTWFDRTNYYETLPSQYLELGLWLESDRMGFLLPALTPEKLENQRQVVMNERRQRVDNQPYGRAFERLHQLMYPSPHPYHWPVLGWMEDIEAATLEDCADFFTTHYSPDNAVLTLCGDFDEGRVLDQVATYFAELPSAGERGDDPALPPLTTDAQREVLEDRVELERIYLGFRAAGFGSSQWYETDLLVSALSAGRSSPMYRDLVEERQLAQGLSFSILPTELESTVALVATVRPEHSAEELESALWQHLEQAAAGTLGEEAIERARNASLTHHYQAVEALDRRADLLSQYAVYTEDPERAFTDLTCYTEPGPEVLERTARDLFRRSRATTIVVSPTSPGTSGEGGP